MTDLKAKLQTVKEAILAYRNGSAVKHPQIHERGDEAIATCDEIMREVEGLGDSWLLPMARINDLQRESVEHTIKRCNQSHFTDVRIRINGDYEYKQADWIKHMFRLPQPPKGNRDE